MRTTQRCKLCPVSPRGDVSAMKALDVVIMIIVSPGSCSTQHLGTARQPPRQPPSRDPSGGRAAQVKTGTGGGDYLNNVTTRNFVKRSNIKQHREYLASRLDTIISTNGNCDHKSISQHWSSRMSLIPEFRPQWQCSCPLHCGRGHHCSGEANWKFYYAFSL